MPFCYQHDNLEVKSLLAQADRAVIYLHDYDAQNPYQAIGTLNASEIQHFGFKDSSPTLSDTCGYQGTLHFFNYRTSLLKIQFNTQEDCQQLTYFLNGRLHHHSWNRHTLATLKQKIQQGFEEEMASK